MDKVIGVLVASIATMMLGIVLQEKQRSKDCIKYALNREIDIDKNIAAVKSWHAAFKRYQANEAGFGEDGLGLKPGLTFHQFVETLGLKKEIKNG